MVLEKVEVPIQIQKTWTNTLYHNQNINSKRLKCKTKNFYQKTKQKIFVTLGYMRWLRYDTESVCDPYQKKKKPGKQKFIRIKNCSLQERTKTQVAENILNQRLDW